MIVTFLTITGIGLWLGLTTSAQSKPKPSSKQVKPKSSLPQQKQPLKTAQSTADIEPSKQTDQVGTPPVAQQKLKPSSKQVKLKSSLPQQKQPLKTAQSTADIEPPKQTDQVDTPPVAQPKLKPSSKQVKTKSSLAKKHKKLFAIIKNSPKIDQNPADIEPAKQTDQIDTPPVAQSKPKPSSKQPKTKPSSKQPKTKPSSKQPTTKPSWAEGKYEKLSALFTERLKKLTKTKPSPAQQKQSVKTPKTDTDSKPGKPDDLSLRAKSEEFKNSEPGKTYFEHAKQIRRLQLWPERLTGSRVSKTESKKTEDDIYQQFIQDWYSPSYVKKAITKWWEKQTVIKATKAKQPNQSLIKQLKKEQLLIVEKLKLEHAIKSLKFWKTHKKDRPITTLVKNWKELKKYFKNSNFELLELINKFIYRLVDKSVFQTLKPSNKPTTKKLVGFENVETTRFYWYIIDDVKDVTPLRLEDSNFGSQLPDSVSSEHLERHFKANKPNVVFYDEVYKLWVQR